MPLTAEDRQRLKAAQDKKARERVKNTPDIEPHFKHARHAKPEDARLEGACPAIMGEFSNSAGRVCGRPADKSGYCGWHKPFQGIVAGQSAENKEEVKM